MLRLPQPRFSFIAVSSALTRAMISWHILFESLSCHLLTVCFPETHLGLVLPFRWYLSTSPLSKVFPHETFTYMRRNFFITLVTVSCSWRKVKLKLSLFTLWGNAGRWRYAPFILNSALDGVKFSSALAPGTQPPAPTEQSQSRREQFAIAGN